MLRLLSRVKRYLRKLKGSGGSDRLRYYETATGNYYLPTDAPEDIVIRTIRNGRIFDNEILAVAKKFITAGSSVLDVGSNFGQMAVLFSGLAGKEGQVYAFEAEKFVFGVLKQNLAANKCLNVVPVFGAVHFELGREVVFPEPDFKRFSAYGSYGIDPKATSGQKVGTVTIDSLKIDRPISFMKIDVQGSDLFALKGAEETIRKHQMPIVFEFEEIFKAEFEVGFQDYVDFVASIDYRFEQVLQGSGLNFLILPKTAPALPP